MGSSRFPMLHGDSLPNPEHGAWIVLRVCDGWVSMISGDMEMTLRLPVDRFNWYWDAFSKASKK